MMWTIWCAPADTHAFELRDGFSITEIYDAGAKGQGSWVSLGADSEGTLFAGSEQGSIYSVSVRSDEDGGPQVQEVLKMGGPVHGIAISATALYLAVNANNDSGGVFRCDRQAVGSFTAPKKLIGVKGQGEHGLHGLTLSRDGKSLFVIAGNYTGLPEVPGKELRSRVPKVWKEDLLLPRIFDPLGHAKTQKAPGGWIARIDLESGTPELFAVGFRNPYGTAVNAAGELFTFDSDMERDVFLPWYRPNRIVHVTSGTDFGWRSGSGKWFPDFPDSLPATLDIGLGSPTGVVFGHGTKFPAKYQRALFALDWRYGRILAVHLSARGASYSATSEVFVQGKPFPVTDAVVGRDGCLYITSGGRGAGGKLHRIQYDRGGEHPHLNEKPQSSPERKLRLHLESLHAAASETSLPEIWPHLNHPDRHVRAAARIALEHVAPDKWASKVADEPDPHARITAAVALARTGADPDRSAAARALSELPYEALTAQQRAELHRAYSLAIARSESFPGEVAAKVRSQLSQHFPAQTFLENKELVEVLVALNDPTVISKTLRAIDQSKERQHIIHFLKALRVCSHQNEGWSKANRAHYFDWLARIDNWQGPAHVPEKTSRVLQDFRGYLNAIRSDALKSLPDKLRDEWRAVLKSTEEADLTKEWENITANGPGKNYSVAEIEKIVTPQLMRKSRSRDDGAGRRMFIAGQCIRCHRFDGEGGIAGPNLSSVANRFSISQIAEAIIEPHKVISDQFASTIFETQDGKTHVGRIVQESIEAILVATDPFDPSKTVSLPVGSIASSKLSPISPMPPALINGMNEQEVLDLFAYLMKTPSDRTALLKPDSLDNWNVVGTARWTVAGGVLRGGQDGDPKRSGLIMTNREFKDFDLELEFKIDEHGKYNSGVYLRHDPKQRGRRGYQVNIGRAAAKEYTGLFLSDWLDKGDEHDKIRKPRKWNRMRVKAVGARIEVWLNSEKIVDYLDPNPEPHLLASGVLALQTYGAEGHSGWVEFRNLTIVDLAPEG